MKALLKRLDRIQMNSLSYPTNIYHQTYTNGRITLDEFNWLMDCGFSISIAIWIEEESDMTPEKYKYKRIINKTGYLPVFEWGES